MTTLQVIWFILVGVLLTGFAILDGFDLGVGFWHLRAKGDKERRILLNAIGPMWDGNEVWLLTGGGALFAAFPPVYASVFSGFYLAMMLLLLVLISRAVSLEFRSKEESTRWRQTWDTVFSVSSTVAIVLFGVALGNIIRGIPLNADGDYTGSFLELLGPFALLIGILSLGMLSFHGANFILVKTTGTLATKAKRWAKVSGIAYLALYIITVAVSSIFLGERWTNYYQYPVLFVIPLMTLGAILLSILWGQSGKNGRAFLASSVSITGMMGISAAAIFPALVPATNNPSLSLTAFNASSSQLTLTTMLVLALIGVPLVLGYTIWAYKSFGGKIDIEHESNHY